jgi:hypothetical protein
MFDGLLHCSVLHLQLHVLLLLLLHLVFPASCWQLQGL